MKAMKAVSAVSAVQERKRALRAAVLARRDALTAAARRDYTAAIIGHVESLPQFRRAGTLLGYCGFGSEIDTSALLQAALAGGKSLVLPRVDRSLGLLELFRVRDLQADTAPGSWGILEPVPARTQRVVVDDLDLVLVPGVAFDRTGGRIGYGKAFYDRLLASCRDPGRQVDKIAAAFEAQVVDAVPMEAHDVRVDALVTEAGVWAFPVTGPGVAPAGPGADHQPETRADLDATPGTLNKLH
jgi:5-formyltetrahydrofolate cyclo-ligase